MIKCGGEIMKKTPWTVGSRHGVGLQYAGESDNSQALKSQSIPAESSVGNRAVGERENSGYIRRAG